MRRKNALLILLFFCLSYGAWAHTMWIETNANGTLQVPQELRVYFGEFSWGKPTPTAKWFSDIGEYTLMMAAPDGTVRQLDKASDSISYKSSFTPTQKGIYTFWLNHEVKDVYKGMKITYTSVATVAVNARRKDTSFVNKGVISFLRKGSSNNLKILKNGHPYSNEAIEVSIEKSTAQIINTNADGMFIVPKHWRQHYLIEIANPVKVQEGAVHNGKPYETDYKIYTYFLKQ